MKDGSPGQDAPPIGELGFQCLALEPAPLPDGEVSILHGQRGQKRELALRERPIESHHLPHQHACRPAVRRDVVEGEEQRMLLTTEADQPGPQQGSPTQVERPQRLRPGQRTGLRLPILGPQTFQVNQGERQVHGGSNDLDGTTGADREGGAQGLMPPHDLLQRRRQSRDVEPSRQPHGGRHIVGCRVRLKLVEEPETLLGEGERQITLARHGPQRRRLEAPLPRLKGLDLGRQGYHGRLLEQATQGQLHPEGLAHPRDHLRGQQRVAAERKEVVLRSHFAQAQHLGPDPRQDLLHRGGRSRRAPPRLWCQAGQGPAIHLPAGRQRERRHLDEHRGHHVVRQRATE